MPNTCAPLTLLRDMATDVFLFALVKFYIKFFFLTRRVVRKVIGQRCVVVFRVEIIGVTEIKYNLS